MTELLILMAGFIVLSGVLAMVDAAVLSVSHAEVEELVLQRKWGALPLRSITKHITRAVVVIVIATNIVNVLGPILVGQKAVALFGSTVIGVITGVLAFLTIIFSEIIPKSLGAHHAPLISRIAAPIIFALIFALYPLVRTLEWFAKLFQSGGRLIGTEDQIRSLVTIGRRSGHIESDEGQLIHRAFILNDKTAADVMTPLKDIVSIADTDTVRQAAEKVFRHSYSRYPVFGSSLHDALGLAMSQDILEALNEGKDSEPVTSIMREILVVDGNMSSDKLLVLFRDRHIHLAIVQLEGKTVGLITLEDVLEELVGDIEDETDIEES